MGVLPSSVMATSKNSISANLNSNIDMIASGTRPRKIAADTSMKGPKWDGLPMTSPVLRDPSIVQMIRNSSPNISHVKMYSLVDGKSYSVVERDMPPKSRRNAPSNQSSASTWTSDPNNANNNWPVESSSVGSMESPDPSIAMIDHYVGPSVADAQLHVSPTMPNPDPRNIRSEKRPSEAPMEAAASN